MIKFYVKVVLCDGQGAASELFLGQGYKTFFMLNSAELEILKAHKYKNIKKFSFFQAQRRVECYFSCS